MHERAPGPWYARLLNERGLGTLLAIVLVGAMLWFGTKIVSDMRDFQTAMIAESARTGEKLSQLQSDHLIIKAQLDRIERSVVAQPAAHSDAGGVSPRHLGTLGERLDNTQLQLTGLDAQLDRIESRLRGQP